MTTKLFRDLKRDIQRLIGTECRGWKKWPKTQDEVQELSHKTQWKSSKVWRWTRQAQILESISKFKKLTWFSFVSQCCLWFNLPLPQFWCLSLPLLSLPLLSIPCLSVPLLNLPVTLISYFVKTFSFLFPAIFLLFYGLEFCATNKRNEGMGESLEKLPRRFAKKRGKRRKENRGTLVTSCASMKSLSIFFSFSRGG